MDNRKNRNLAMAAMMSMLGSANLGNMQPIVIGDRVMPMGGGRRIVKKKPPRKFGEPVGPPLNWDRIKPNPGETTSLRHDQVERRRVCRQKKNSLKFKPYHKRKNLCASSS